MGCHCHTQVACFDRNLRVTDYFEQPAQAYFVFNTSSPLHHNGLHGAYSIMLERSILCPTIYKS